MVDPIFDVGKYYPFSWRQNVFETTGNSSVLGFPFNANSYRLQDPSLLLASFQGNIQNSRFSWPFILFTIAFGTSLITVLRKFTAPLQSYTPIAIANLSIQINTHTESPSEIPVTAFRQRLKQQLQNPDDVESALTALSSPQPRVNNELQGLLYDLGHCERPNALNAIFSFLLEHGDQPAVAVLLRNFPFGEGQFVPPRQYLIDTSAGATHADAFRIVNEISDRFQNPSASLLQRRYWENTFERLPPNGASRTAFAVEMAVSCTARPSEDRITRVNQAFEVLFRQPERQRTGSVSNMVRLAYAVLSLNQEGDSTREPMRHAQEVLRSYGREGHDSFQSLPIEIIFRMVRFENPNALTYLRIQSEHAQGLMPLPGLPVHRQFSGFAALAVEEAQQQDAAWFRHIEQWESNTGHPYRTLLYRQSVANRVVRDVLQRRMRENPSFRQITPTVLAEMEEEAAARLPPGYPPSLALFERAFQTLQRYGVMQTEPFSPSPRVGGLLEVLKLSIPFFENPLPPRAPNWVLRVASPDDAALVQLPYDLWPATLLLDPENFPLPASIAFGRLLREGAMDNHLTNPRFNRLLQDHAELPPHQIANFFLSVLEDLEKPRSAGRQGHTDRALWWNERLFGRESDSWVDWNARMQHDEILQNPHALDTYLRMALRGYEPAVDYFRQHNFSPWRNANLPLETAFLLSMVSSHFANPTVDFCRDPEFVSRFEGKTTLATHSLWWRMILATEDPSLLRRASLRAPSQPGSISVFSNSDLIFLADQGHEGARDFLRQVYDFNRTTAESLEAPSSSSRGSATLLPTVLSEGRPPDPPRVEEPAAVERSPSETARIRNRRSDPYGILGDMMRRSRH